MIIKMKIRSMIEVLVVQDNQTVNNSNVSMRLFDSIGELNGRVDEIWDDRLIAFLLIW